MADYALKSYAFRNEREESWKELEGLVVRAERRGVHTLSSDELHRLPALYRGVLSSLSVSRAISLDKNVTDYLEGLAARAYFTVYCRKRFLGASLWTFLGQTFPRYIRGMRWALFLAIGLMALGTACGFLMTQEDPDRYFTFVSEDMASGRTPTASKAELEEALASRASAGELTRFAAFLFSHNSRVAILCFALGFVFGIPTMLLLFINGLSLGAMWSVYADAGLGLDFMAWVLPHGVTELLAICLAGAAGMSLGYAVVFPGRYRRLTNLAIVGRRAAAVVIGAVVMLFFAAILEGFFRQLVHSTDIRVAVVVVTFAFWLVYLRFAGREPTERLQRVLAEHHSADVHAVAQRVRAMGAPS